jgi:glucans biosynthesis protein
VLVEIPTDAETNDNIVAFWKPDQAIQAGKQYRLEYSLSFGGPSVAGHPGGQAANTFIGDGDRIGGGETEGAYRIIVDFAGGELGELPADAAVVSKVSGGESVEVLEHFVEYVPESGHWRLSMLARPAPQATMELRAHLELKGKVLTETWSYSLPPGTGLRANQR